MQFEPTLSQIEKLPLVVKIRRMGINFEERKAGGTEMGL